MYISVPLLFFFIGSTSAKKQGDFGIFTACTDEGKNGSLRLKCFYPECPYSSHTTFSCEFQTSDKRTLAIKENMMCKNYTVPLTVHNPKEGNMTNFTCILTRKKRKEMKNITINYSIQKGQHHILGCRAAAPTSLWPVVILSLWRVVDSQLT